MRSLNSMLIESIFDIDDNIDAMDYHTSQCGKMGVKSITLSVFSTQYDEITDDLLKRVILDNFSKDFDLGIDAKIFNKNIKIHDKYGNELKVSSKNKEKIYNMIERVLREWVKKDSEYGDIISKSTGVRNEMQSWLKNNIKGDNHQFRYWAKSGTMQIAFCPKRGDYIVRMYISVNESL